MNNPSDKKTSPLPIIIMGVLMLSGVLKFYSPKLNFAGLSIYVGIIMIFIDRRRNKKTYEDIGFNIKTIGKDFLSVWWIVFLPIGFDIVSIVLSNIVCPGFIDHLISRVDFMLNPEVIVVTIIKIIIFAFGEEIACRAFLQNRISGIFKPVMAIIITSLLFAVAHISTGIVWVVVYDVFFVFANSVIYGVLFYKTKNVYISTISHIISNLFGVFILFSI